MGLILGLCGWPGAGKSEVRKILVSNFGFEDINSKATIYQLAEVATGIPAHKFSDPFYKEGEYLGSSYRQIAAFLGYAVEDLFGQDYLIKQAMLNHRVSERPHKNFVIDSLRMQQPLLFATSMHIVEVVSNKAETPGNDFDRYVRPNDYYTIRNDGTKGCLVEEVGSLLKKLGA